MPYDPDFIAGHSIPLPIPSDRVSQSAFGGDFIHHLRHSVLFNVDRGFAFVSAHNIDGPTIPSSQFTTRSFKNDPKIQPTSLQVDRDRGYRESPANNLGPNPWDQGHLARRKSLSWGTEADARIAERESDMWSNVAPQHENLHDDAWGSIEDWMLERVQGDGQRACVFTGPVFTDDDPVHVNGPNEEAIRIPAGYWKLISVQLDGAMRSAGFLVWQRDYDSDEPLPFAPVLEQVRLTTIEVLTGLTFPALRQFDPLLFSTDATVGPLTTGLARAIVRERLLAGRLGMPGDAVTELGEEMLMRATRPGTAAVTSVRDIVL
jgi:endonuclease G